MIPFLGDCAITRVIKWPGHVMLNDHDLPDKWRAANLDPQVEE